MADQRNTNDFRPGRPSRHGLTATLSVLPIVLSFLNVAIAITIIGLAADSIAWAGGRGSEESNTVYAIVLGPAGHGNDTYDRWFTRMHYLPQYYDTQTFSALVSAGAVCVLAGLIAGSLSIMLRARKVRLVLVAMPVNTTLKSTGPLAHDPSFLPSARGPCLPDRYHRPHLRAGTVRHRPGVRWGCVHEWRRLQHRAEVLRPGSPVQQQHARRGHQILPLPQALQPHELELPPPRPHLERNAESSLQLVSGGYRGKRLIPRAGGFAGCGFAFACVGLVLEQRRRWSG